MHFGGNGVFLGGKYSKTVSLTAPNMFLVELCVRGHTDCTKGLDDKHELEKKIFGFFSRKTSDDVGIRESIRVLETMEL